ncbi:hypothetical protein [Fulvimarina sp. MAC8]|uniref:hypothetical protein n=1 Tax=Fulvimarina sp. MAC8 TaxID=3162874 RepID=UPI0032EE5796
MPTYKPIFVASTMFSAFAFSDFAPQASAQSMDNAPMPSGGAVVEYGAGIPLGQRGQFYGLPGVDLNDGVGKVRRRGPGGLENNVGAIGMATPSTSSSNPQPLLDDTPTTNRGIPINR